MAAANAGLLPQQVLHQSQVLVQQPQLIQKVASPLIAKHVEEYDAHPQYNFAYDIQDSLTGDSKNQHETRDGDVVQGQYSLTDPDGYRRTVDYTSDPINGFNAVVSRQPLGVVKTAVVAHQPAVIAHQPAVIAHQPALIAHQQAPVVTVARSIHGHAGFVPQYIH